MTINIQCQRIPTANDASGMTRMDTYSSAW